ncbi:MAG: archease [Anaerolineales bacterium]
MNKGGFEEVDHTADWSIRVWGSDMEELLRQAAKGMLQLLNARPEEGQGNWLDIDIEAEDPEELMVSWLEELLFLHETKHITFLEFDFRSVGEKHLSAAAKSAPSKRPDKHIKAVTFHNMDIIEKDGNIETEIVFDV